MSDPDTPCNFRWTHMPFLCHRCSNRLRRDEHKELRVPRKAYHPGHMIVAFALSIYLRSQYSFRDHQFRCRQLLNFHTPSSPRKQKVVVELKQKVTCLTCYPGLKSIYATQRSDVTNPYCVPARLLTMCAI